MIEIIETNGIQEYSPVELGLQELRRKYANVAVDVGSSKALEEAKRVRAEIRAPRYECEKIRKALKAPALAHAKLIDTEAARITAELLEIETPWDEAIKTEELRKETEKAEREAAERARVTAINEKIANLRGFPSLALECRTAERVAGLIEKLKAIEPTEDDYQEFLQEALTVKEVALSRMAETHASRLAEEAERARVKAEQEAAAEALRIEREAMAKEQAEAEAKRKAEAAALAAQREAFAAAQAEAKRIADEAEAKVRAAAEEMAAQRAAFEAEQEAARLALVEEARRIADERAALEAAKAPAIPEPNQPLAHKECAHAAIETVAPAISLATVLQAVGVADLLDSEPMELTGQPLSIAIHPTSPPVEALIQAVADTFSVSLETAADWLTSAADDIANFQ